MKRLLLIAPLALGLCFAQEQGTGEGAKKESGQSEEGGLEIWKWANFLVLAGGLGYLIGKNAGPFFAARSAAILRDMEESQRQRKEAEASAAEVDRRLSNLEAEIASLRAEGERELHVGAERVRRQTSEELAKIQRHSVQEIEIAGKAAHAELKRYTAELAIGLAEQKARARMTPAVQDALIDGFVRELR
jgi:F-type H+-transporting ATPase subunit b